MNVLLDHCMPRRFAGLLPGHIVRTSKSMGWADLQNGRLLQAASEAFDVVITVDRNLAHQQAASTLPVTVIAIQSVDTRFPALAALAPEVCSLLNQRLVKRVYVVRASMR